MKLPGASQAGFLSAVAGLRWRRPGAASSHSTRPRAERNGSKKITPDAGDYGSLLATGGGLVFGTSGGTIFALDADNGRETWCLSLGGPTRSGLVSFTVDGQQVILVLAGQAIVELGL